MFASSGFAPIVETNDLCSTRGTYCRFDISRDEIFSWCREEGCYENRILKGFKSNHSYIFLGSLLLSHHSCQDSDRTTHTSFPDHCPFLIVHGKIRSEPLINPRRNLHPSSILSLITKPSAVFTGTIINQPTLE